MPCIILLVVLLPTPSPCSALEVGAAEEFFDVRDANVGSGHERNSLQWALTCLHECERVCLTEPPERGPFLRLLRWSERDDCAYRCVHACLAEGKRHGGKLYKYRGKWPHTRLLGMQEPLSTAFSLVNAASHVAGWMMLAQTKLAMPQLRHVDLQHHLQRLQMMSGLWVLAWMCSAVFHARDNWLTERLDYYSGNVALTYMVYVGLLRAGWVGCGFRWAPLRIALGTALSGGIATHMALNFHKIDYTRNMHVMIGLLSAHSVAWLCRCRVERAPHNKYMYLSAGLTYAAGALEIFDFPPVLGSLDAHALWHAATPPLTYLFYRFLAADLLVAVAKTD